jgi:ABC-type polar amino acid transport system ATPase subunit
MDFARDVSDHVIFLDEGKPVEMSTPADFSIAREPTGRDNF